MRPIEFVYKLHPWRKPKKGSEAGWVLSQFLGEFYSHDFSRVYKQHLSASGRELPSDRALHAKLWYHFEKGYLIRRGFWNNDWKEWKGGREVPLQGKELEEVKQEVVEEEIDRLLATIPDKETAQPPAETQIETDLMEDVLKKIGY